MAGTLTNGQPASRAASVDTAFGIPEGDRFEEYRQEIISVHPKVAEVSRASHIWGYFMDMQDPGETFGPLMAEGQDDQECLLASYLELGALVCVHPVTARIMTTHGDFHHGNILDAAGRQLLCVGFEGTCVSQASVFAGWTANTADAGQRITRHSVVVPPQDERRSVPPYRAVEEIRRRDMWHSSTAGGVGANGRTVVGSQGRIGKQQIKKVRITRGQYTDNG